MKTEKKNADFLCVRGVPDDLQREFKGEVKKSGHTIKEVVTHLMKEFIRLQKERG